MEYIGVVVMELPNEGKALVLPPNLSALTGIPEDIESVRAEIKKGEGKIYECGENARDFSRGMNRRTL